MNKLFTRFHNIRRFTSVFFVLYIIHSFSITSLIAAPSYKSQIHISDMQCLEKSQKNGGLPQKNKNRPYSLFIAKHSAAKFTRAVEPLPVAVVADVVSVPQPEKIIYFTSDFNAYCRPDDAYKRYRLIRVFLI